MKRRKKHNPYRRHTLRRLVRIALRNANEDVSWRAASELRMRGSPATLALARTLSASLSWRRRRLGLWIASQLRQRRGRDLLRSVEFALEETQALLLAGLLDSHDEVVQAAVSGMGHRPHPDGLSHLLQLSTHPSAGLRWDVAIALAKYEEPDAIDALLRLATDPDDDVRDWATFGLGSIQTADTPAIRALLWKNLHDADSDVRGEALVGLAERGDPRAIDHLEAHLSLDSLGYELNAAERLASPRLLSALQKVAAGVSETEAQGYWFTRLQAAITACSTKAQAAPAPSTDSPSRHL